MSSDEPRILEQRHPPAGGDCGQQPKTAEAKLDDLTQTINISSRSKYGKPAPR